MNPAFDLNFVFNAIPDIVKAIPISLAIMVASFLFGLFLGLVLTIMRLKKGTFSFTIATSYISFIRGTPTLIQLFLVYYGLPKLLELVGININDLSKLVFAIITFTLNSGAFLSEVIRSSYLAVDSGQLEAAFSVGMSRGAAVRRIIFPQALTIALPNLGNSVISLLKESSLAFMIGVNDIMGAGLIVSGRGYGVHNFETYIAVSLVYWALCYLVEKSLTWLENAYTKG